MLAIIQDIKTGKRLESPTTGDPPPMDPIEPRVAALETSVRHIESDVSEIKGDIRRLEDKIETKFQALEVRTNTLDIKFDTKLDRITWGIIGAIAIPILIEMGKILLKK